MQGKGKGQAGRVPLRSSKSKDALPMHVGYDYFSVCLQCLKWFLLAIIFHFWHQKKYFTSTTESSVLLLTGLQAVNNSHHRTINYFTTICLLSSGLTDAKAIGYTLKTRSNNPYIASLSLQKSNEHYTFENCHFYYFLMAPKLVLNWDLNTK